MAFEKAKVLKAAEKFLSQGKIPAAIKEYRQIVENDPDDLTTLNMLGDLCVRAGNNEEAVSCFERIAEHYREQEFNLKAIAMYKKIERLKPRDPDIALKLADLYANQGLVVDARAQYLTVADAHTRSGQNKNALDVLHRIADLDPNNTDIRLKLAEGYLKENMRREATGAYVQAANRLQHTGNHEKALDAFVKALRLAPDDADVLGGLLEVHISRGSADEAAELLEQIINETPEDPRLVPMLARAYLEAEDPKGAERATTMLMGQNPSNYTQFLPVARLYLKAGDPDDSVRILSGVIERMLAGREEKDLLGIVDEILERNPDHVGALRMLVRIHWWQRDMDALRSVLERLAESAEAAELVDEERYALTQLVRLAPDETKYLTRLKLLGGSYEETVDEYPVATQEVPEFETFSIVEEESVATDESVATMEIEANSANPQAVSDPTASFADLSEQAAPSPGAGDFQEVDFGETSEAQVTAQPAESSEEERLDNMMRQELESVDFYIAQGYTDIAIDTLEMLERQFGAHRDIVARREKLDAASAKVTEAPAEFEFGGIEATSIAVPQEETISIDTAFAPAAPENNEHVPVATKSADASPVKAGIDAGLAELFEEFRVAEEEAASTTTEDFETHYNMGIAYKEMDLIDEAIQEFQTSAGLVKANDGTSRFLQACNMLGHCFMKKGMPQAAVIWFQKGLSAPGQSEDEYQALRYELGSAYEQMGDTEKAKELYTEVYGADISYREVANKLSSLGDRQGKKKKK